MQLEQHFARFRQGILGIDQTFESPCGRQKIVYADWIASGRLYGPIEHHLIEHIAPFVANTHTETSVTGSMMTRAYHEALHRIKAHVGAGQCDAIICYGSGMTAVVNKRAGGMGLISGRKAFQRPMREGVQLLNTIQDVYLCKEVTIA